MSSESAEVSSGDSLPVTLHNVADICEENVPHAADTDTSLVNLSNIFSFTITDVSMTMKEPTALSLWRLCDIASISSQT